jgi:hypothetical protein
MVISLLTANKKTFEEVMQEQSREKVKHIVMPQAAKTTRARRPGQRVQARKGMSRADGRQRNKERKGND